MVVVVESSIGLRLFEWNRFDSAESEFVSLFETARVPAGGEIVCGRSVEGTTRNDGLSPPAPATMQRHRRGTATSRSATPRGGSNASFLAHLT